MHGPGPLGAFSISITTTRRSTDHLCHVLVRCRLCVKRGSAGRPVGRDPNDPAVRWAGGGGTTYYWGGKQAASYIAGVTLLTRRPSGRSMRYVNQYSTARACSSSTTTDGRTDTDLWHRAALALLCLHACVARAAPVRRQRCRPARIRRRSPSWSGTGAPPALAHACIYAARARHARGYGSRWHEHEHEQCRCVDECEHRILRPSPIAHRML